MSLLSNIKKILKKKDNIRASLSENRYIPEKNPEFDDEIFAYNFTKNGGKFIYCETDIEIHQAFVGILKELEVQTKIGFHNHLIKEAFSQHEHLFTSNLEIANVFITDCESLISNDGAILLSSTQLKQKMVSQLPETIIVYATTSQIVKEISDAMRVINKRYTKRKPSGITTIKNFGINQEDFRNYGSCPKKMYLILKEDVRYDAKS